jgi:hypothetical protein
MSVMEIQDTTFYAINKQNLRKHLPSTSESIHYPKHKLPQKEDFIFGITYYRTYFLRQVALFCTPLARFTTFLALSQPFQVYFSGCNKLIQLNEWHVAMGSAKL